MAKEYIERNALYKWLDLTMLAQGTVAGKAYVRMFWDKVRSIPAADVVEVVRCKDCKHSDLCGESGQCLHPYGLTVCDGNDFCSCGERRDSDGR